MRALKLFGRVYVHAEPIDFRVRRLGLAAYIQNVMGRNLFEGALFVFRNRSAKSVRIVYWDRTGIAMWEKCLEKDRFPWIAAGNDQALCITPHELEMLLDGIDITKIKPHKDLHYSHV
jgi:transposase